MVRVNDKGSCELLVVIVKIEARLEMDTYANGACLQCQSNYYDLFYKIKLMLVKYTINYTLSSQQIILFFKVWHNITQNWCRISIPIYRI